MSKLTRYKIMKHEKKIAAGIVAFTVLISPLLSDTAAQILFDTSEGVWIEYMHFAFFIADLF